MANLNLQNLQNISLSHNNPFSISGQVKSQGNVAPWNTSLGNLTGNLTLHGLLGVTHGEHVKKYEILEIDEDLLALSTAWKRLRDTHNSGGTYTPISTLLDKELFNHVTIDDRQKANEIRDYYSKKIMMWKLKDSIPAGLKGITNARISGISSYLSNTQRLLIQLKDKVRQYKKTIYSQSLDEKKK